MCTLYNQKYVIGEAYGELYAVLAVLAQRALNSRELCLTIVMAAVFNGVSSVVNIPHLLAGDILLLPWIIAPVGLVVMVVCVLLLRQVMLQARQGQALAYGEINI
jgi:hypothetical protein